MVGNNDPITLYRVAKKFPPAESDYLSHQARGRVPPDDASEQELRSWDALSAWETAALAREIADRFRSAKWIVRYVIPATAAGVTYEPSPPPGHYDPRGDVEELKEYLDTDFKVEV